MSFLQAHTQLWQILWYHCLVNVKLYWFITVRCTALQGAKRLLFELWLHFMIHGIKWLQKKKLT